MRLAPGEPVGEHARLLMRGFDQAVADAAVLGAFADRVDAGSAGLECIVDHDAALDRDAGIARQIGARPDADRHDHRVGRDGAAVLQRDGLDAMFAADLHGVGLEHDLDPHCLDGVLQHPRRLRVELALHQPVHQVQHRHARARLGEAVGGLEPEQSAADHHDTVAGSRAMPDGPDVADVAERDHARQCHAGDLRPDRLRAGGEHEPGEGQGLAVGERDRARGRVDRGRAAAIAQRDAAIAPPGLRLELDIRRCDLAGEHRGEQHAVVGEPRLLTDDGDRVAAERAGAQLVGEACGRHAVADHHKRFAHSKLRWTLIRRSASLRSTARRSAAAELIFLPPHAERGRASRSLDEAVTL